MTCPFFGVSDDERWVGTDPSRPIPQGAGATGQGDMQGHAPAHSASRLGNPPACALIPWPPRSGSRRELDDKRTNGYVPKAVRLGYPQAVTNDAGVEVHGLGGKPRPGVGRAQPGVARRLAPARGARATREGRPTLRRLRVPEDQRARAARPRAVLVGRGGTLNQGRLRAVQLNGAAVADLGELVRQLDDSNVVRIIEAVRIFRAL